MLRQWQSFLHYVFLLGLEKNMEVLVLVLRPRVLVLVLVLTKKVLFTSLSGGTGSCPDKFLLQNCRHSFLTWPVGYIKYTSSIVAPKMFAKLLHWLAINYIIWMLQLDFLGGIEDKLCERPPQYAPALCDLWPFDLESGVRVTRDVGYLYANFSLPTPLCSRLRPDVRGRETSDSITA